MKKNYSTYFTSQDSASFRQCQTSLHCTQLLQKCVRISLCLGFLILGSINAQTPLAPGDTMFLNSGVFYYNLSPGTYYLYDDGGENNYSNNIKSEINMFAPNCEIYFKAVGFGGYFLSSTDIWSISNRNGDQIRRATSTSAAVDQVVYEYARSRLLTDASSVAAGIKYQINVKLIDTLPYNIEIRNITATSATITWQDNQASHTQWIVQYAPYGNFWGTGTGTGKKDTVSTKIITLTGLNSDTRYAFFVYPKGYAPQGYNGANTSLRYFYYSCNLDDHPREFTTLRLENYEECLPFTDLSAENVKGSYGSITPTASTYPYANPDANNGILIDSLHRIHHAGEMNDQHTLLKLPTVPPFAQNSVRLGNWSTNNDAERISFDYTVTDTNKILLFKYAPVFQYNTPSPTTRQPKLELKLLNSDGNELDCFKICDSASSTLATNNKWNIVKYNAGGATINNAEAYTSNDLYFNIYWKDWTTIGIDLSPYSGQKLTVQVTTYDAARSTTYGYGYAYLNFACTSKNIYTLTCLSNDYSFSAPPGFTYEWYEQSNPSAVLATTQNFVTTIAGTYFCRCSSLGTPGCNFTLSVVAPMDGCVTPTNYSMQNWDEISVSIQPNPMLMIVNSPVCQEDTIELTWTGEKGVALNAITANIVGKNSCDMCNGLNDKWINIPVSFPTLETQGECVGTYSGAVISGLAAGSWTFHINSVTVGTCSNTNPTQIVNTDCLERSP